MRRRSLKWKKSSGTGWKSFIWEWRSNSDLFFKKCKKIINVDSWKYCLLWLCSACLYSFCCFCALSTCVKPPSKMEADPLIAISHPNPTPESPTYLCYSFCFVFLISGFLCCIFCFCVVGRCRMSLPLHFVPESHLRWSCRSLSAFLWRFHDFCTFPYWCSFPCLTC